MKVCSKCKIEQPITEYWKYKDNRLRNNCKTCCKQITNEWRLKNKGHIKVYSKEEYFKNKMKHRNRHLMYKFGITHIQYEEMLRTQNNKCAICKSTQTGQYEYFLIDHNHSSNKLRGLLCFGCNSALGQFKENKEALLEAIKYLEKYAN